MIKYQGDRKKGQERIMQWRMRYTWKSWLRMVQYQ